MKKIFSPKNLFFLVTTFLFLLFALSSQIFAVNIYPTTLTVTSSNFSIFDLMNFDITIKYKDGSVFNLPKKAAENIDYVRINKLAAGQNPKIVTAFDLYTDSPNIVVSDDGKEVKLSVPVLKEAVKEFGFDMPPGSYEAVLYDAEGGYPGVVIGKAGFSVVTPPSPDQVRFKQWVYKTGMEPVFTLYSTEEDIDYLPLPFVYTGVDTEGRDYLSEGDFGLKLERGGIFLGNLSSDDRFNVFNWNEDGTYSFPTASAGGYAVTLLGKDGQSAHSLGVGVYDGSIIETELIPEEFYSGSTVKFRMYYLENQPFYLPNLIDPDFSGAFWEAFDSKEAYVFELYTADGGFLDDEFLYLGKDGVYQAEEGQYVETTVKLSDISPGDYVVKIFLVNKDSSFLLGEKGFTVLELVPAQLALGNELVLPSTTISLAVYGGDGVSPTDVGDDMNIAVYVNQDDFAGNSFLLSLADGEIADADGTGNYTFVAPELEGTYRVRLYYKDSRTVLDTVEFTVDNEAVLPDAVEGAGDEGDGLVEGNNDLLDENNEDDPASLAGGVAVGDRCAGFADVSIASKYCEAITWAKENGIVQGYSDGTFKENKEINRVEMLKVVLLGLNVVIQEYDEGMDLNLGFSDVYPDQWYMSYIKTGRLFDIFVGDAGRNTARPGDTVNRVEAVKLAFETMRLVYEYNLESCEENPYEDTVAGQWYYKYACAAKEFSLFDLVDAGKLVPGFLSTRGEIVLMLFRLSDAGLFVVDFVVE